MLVTPPRTGAGRAPQLDEVGSGRKRGWSGAVYGNAFRLHELEQRTGKVDRQENGGGELSGRDIQCAVDFVDGKREEEQRTQKG